MCLRNVFMNWDKDAVFYALGDSTRRLILDELSERKEMTMYELTARLVMNHQLSISRQAIGTLGFIKKHDVLPGYSDGLRLFLPMRRGGTELLLEPNEHPAAKDYQSRSYDSCLRRYKRQSDSTYTAITVQAD